MGRTHPKGERDYAVVSTNSQAGRPKRCSKLLSVQSTTTKRAIGAKALSWTYRRASCGVVTMKNSATNRMTTSATRAQEVERAWVMDMVAPIRKMEPCPNGDKSPNGWKKSRWPVRRQVSMRSSAENRTNLTSPSDNLQHHDAYRFPAACRARRFASRRRFTTAQRRCSTSSGFSRLE